jgi:hypothetical protein
VLAGCDPTGVVRRFLFLNCRPVIKFLLIPFFWGCPPPLSCPPVATAPQCQEEDKNAVAEDAEDAASGLTRRNSSDSLPSSSCTHMNTSFSSFAAGATSTPPSTNNNVQQVQLFDLDEAMMGSELKDRSAGMFGDHHQPETNDDDDDPFADDCSAVFDVDEDFLLLDTSSDDLSTTSDVQVQEALRGLTLEAKMSLVELVRSNSIGQISGLLLVA